MPGSRLLGKSAIVTASARGIGFGIASILAAEGAQILLVDLNENLGVAAVKKINDAGGNASYFKADVTSEEDMKKMAQVAVSRNGRLDILCHNAGIYPRALIQDMTVAEWDRVFAVNTKAAFLAVKACLPQMQTQRYGKIVLTSSITGPRTGVAGFSHYSASKSAIIGFIHSAALELVSHNITINAIEPGSVLTEGIREVMAKEGLGEDYLTDLAKTIPMGRLAKPEEMGRVALFLASDDSSFITGQSIVVDGGQILPESGSLTK
jgi:3-oxoacyl-[acyl-carrier protein] reductase